MTQSAIVPFPGLLDVPGEKLSLGVCVDELKFPAPGRPSLDANTKSPTDTLANAAVGLPVALDNGVVEVRPDSVHAPRISKLPPVIAIVCVPEPGEAPATYQISAPPMLPMSVQLTPFTVTPVYAPGFALATATTTTRLVAAVPIFPEMVRTFPPPPVLSATVPTRVNDGPAGALGPELPAPRSDIEPPNALTETPTVTARAKKNVRSLRIAILVELKRDTQHEPPKTRRESAAF
jgi:hypothetical protein